MVSDFIPGTAYVPKLCLCEIPERLNLRIRSNRDLLARCYNTRLVHFRSLSSNEHIRQLHSDLYMIAVVSRTTINCCDIRRRFAKIANLGMER